MLQLPARGTHRQFAVQHALGAPHHVGDLPHPAGLALDQQDLGAQVLVEMHVRRGQDRRVLVVLQLDQLLRQAANVMVEDQRDGADHFLVPVPLLLDQLASDQIADELGAVGVAALSERLA